MIIGNEEAAQGTGLWIFSPILHLYYPHFQIVI